MTQHPWILGLGSLAIGLYGAYTARDRGLSQRRGLALLGWIPFALWAAFTLVHAGRTP